MSDFSIELARLFNRSSSLGLRSKESNGFFRSPVSFPNAATLSIADRLTDQATIAETGKVTGRLNFSRANVTSNALETISDHLGGLRQLAFEAVQGLTGSERREDLQTLAQQISQDITDVVNNSTFNKQAILQGGQVETNIGGSSFSFQNPNGQLILDKIANIDLSSQTGAEAALTNINEAVEESIFQRTAVSNTASAINIRTESAINTANALYAAADITAGTDLPSLFRAVELYGLQQKVGLKMASDMYKFNRESVLSLLGLQ
ncbi:hypothetical protein JYU14_03355 [Simkania negevensis]|uniref:Flagellin N-terminal domain-containing protein n=1 Tax=Simkania negevensis TaxID=83561 RepID=A0ABS3AQU8_9BACT|nr:hypothetical protein [Simkania negevensis]